MQAELKSIHSPDAESLENYIPDDPHCFLLFIELFIGPKEEVGGELFNIEICTPKWLLTRAQECGVVFGCNYLIVANYNWDLIYKSITDKINAMHGASWDDLAAKLSKLGRSEFEDYDDTSPSIGY